MSKQPPARIVRRTLCALFVLVIQTSLSFAGLVLPTPAEQPFNPPIQSLITSNPPAYMQVTLSWVPGGYSVTNGVYPAWCVSSTLQIFFDGINGTYTPILYDTSNTAAMNAVAPSLNPPPVLAGPDSWNKINYILNNKGTANLTSIQCAIWRFINYDAAQEQSKINGPATFGRPLAVLDEINALAAAANNFGATFVPGPGQVAAVYLDFPIPPNPANPPPYSSSLQPLIIEVVTPPGSTPCVELTKTSASPTAQPGGSMVYTYVIKNCGNTDLADLAIIDDNGTPADTSDDFTVANDIDLAAGVEKSFTATVFLPTLLCSGPGNPSPSAGSLTTVVLPNGDFQVTLTQARTLNDNTYGTSAPAAGWSSHSFGNLTGSDKANFRFTNGAGVVVLDFYLDYLSSAASKTFPSGTVNYPSGYGTLGANGGDGQMVAGSLAHVLFATTSMTDNLNSGLNGGFPSPYLVNSPTPEASFPNWDYFNRYTVIVSKNAFGVSGFGGVTIPDIHNSPAKTGDNQITPVPCGDCITNVARVVTVLPGNQVGAILDTDDAVVCVGTQTPPCLLSTQNFKIDRKKVSFEIKNNGTANVFLSELALTWPQAINGNLVKVTLNGDVWVGSASSPAVINSGFNADPNKRRIQDGEKKTLVLEFANNASKTLGNYSGVVKFGSDASCAIAFPPEPPVAPFDCDGHIAELKMKWAGTQNIKVVAHYGNSAATAVLATIDNVVPGQVVTVSGYTGSPNDVIWEIFQAGTNIKIGESQFHTSCSDSTMDGPEDCGSAQGNGKSNLATVNGFPTLNNWTFVGLKTIKGTTLLCP